MDYYKLAEFEGKRQYFKIVAVLNIDVGSKVNGSSLIFSFSGWHCSNDILKERFITK